MADIVDDTREVIISALPALEEGQARIINVDAPVEGIVGETISVQVEVSNIGAVLDSFFVTLYDSAAGLIDESRSDISTTTPKTFTFNFTMPDRLMWLIIEAGHEE